MKRILVLALALILSVSSLAVPSHAASVPQAAFDLLNVLEYELIMDGNSSILYTPSRWVSNVRDVGYLWNIYSTSRFSRIVVYVRTHRKPDNLYLNQYGSFGDVAGTYLGSHGNIHCYSFDRVDNSTALYIHAAFNSVYSGDFALISCFGYVTNSVEITNVSYFANAMMYDNGDGEGSPPDPEDFRWPVSVGSGNNVSLPVVVDFSGPTGSDFYSVDYGEVFLKVPFDSVPKALNSVSFILFTCGEISSIGARLEQSNGTFIAGLSSELSYCGETQMVFELEEQFERIHSYIVTVDVSGYDLSGSLLTLQMNIPSVFGSYIYQYDRGFYFQCSSVVASYDLDETPWYTYFGIWLKNQYTQIKNTISSGVASITSGLTIIDTSVRNWLASVNQTLTNGFNRLASLLSPDADTDGFQDQVDDQGDRLDQMDDALSSVTKPALDRVDTNISGIVSDTDLANTAHVYTYIIDDNIMAPALTMVTILAMMSFALFGKR